jgi:hypothetical protein
VNQVDAEAELADQHGELIHQNRKRGVVQGEGQKDEGEAAQDVAGEQITDGGGPHQRDKEEERRGKHQASRAWVAVGKFPQQVVEQDAAEKDGKLREEPEKGEGLDQVLVVRRIQGG